ncbi:protein LONGIFOLIA 2-like [Canna indica]|uniref:Protein LONGIFOLIA 2-like n=1 Tax=Canna indica TaxID=4628 RepID=A0AAQ3Q8I6_9LILI|nr:protein LONGIFOLIA 2-like [Canna indica]
MREMTDHAVVLEEQRLERQMGCMAGFLQLFDRNHIIAGRRSFSTRRLPTSPTAASTSPSERSEASSASFFKESQPHPSSPEPCRSSPESQPAEETPVPARRSLPLPLRVFEATDGGKTSWRVRDSPRLSLDSRAVVDARGKLRPRDIRTSVPVVSGNQSDASEASDDQRRSPSVVARLMGLDGLPSGARAGTAETDRAELRRSASESRLRKDPSCYGYAGAESFHKFPPEAAPISAEEFFKSVSLAQFKLNNTAKAKPPSRTTPLQRKCFDAEDFFPDPKRSGTLYGEIEKRLRMRGIEEPAKDMETVKQILEALQLKGLLHSNPSDHIVSARRNLIYDYQRRTHGDAPIVIMKPAAKPPRRPSSEPPPLPRGSGAARRSPPPVRHEQTAIDRSIRGGNERRNRGSKSPESPNSPVSRRPSNAAAQKSQQPLRRTPTVNSPKSSPRRSGLDPLPVRSPRHRRPAVDATPEANIYAPAEDDTSTSFSESSISASSQLDFERSKAEEYNRRGRSLLENLERCGKLVHNIEAFTGAEQVTAADQQPSPVSVLDSSYLGEDGSPSPSPLTKRSIDFQDPTTDDWDELKWSPLSSTNHGDAGGGCGHVDQDYAYVCKVVRACERYGNACDAVYGMLEKRCCRLPGEASCKAARLHRRLIFDTVVEILARKRRVSPWDAFSRATKSSPGGQEDLLQHVWAEVRRIREPEEEDDDEFGREDATVGGAVRKDIDGGQTDGWARPATELSDAVLHIERLIFKDLVDDTIRDLAATAAEAHPRLLSRRKLDF